MLNKSRSRKNNKGFTLVELVCAIAILAIVGISIVSFVSISSKSFSESSSDVNLQYEAQVAANQIKDLVMNSNRAVHYYEVTSPAEAHCFMVLNEKPIVVSGVSTYEFPAVKIWYVPDDNTIYYATKTFSFDEVNQKYIESGNTKVDMKELGETISSGSVLAKNVSSFSVDDSKADTEGKVELSIGVSISGKNYTSNPVIVMRNKVIASANAAEIFTGARVEVDDGRILSADILYGGSPVTGNTLNWANNGINKPWSGSFTADVDAVQLSSDVVWSLIKADGNISTSMITSQNGHSCTVQIASDETNTSLILEALLSDGTKKQVTLQVPSIDMTTGYLETLTLSDPVHPDPTLYLDTYTFDVSQTFVNGEAVADKGFTFEILKGRTKLDTSDTSYPGITFVGTDTVKLTFSKPQSNASYTLKVISNAVGQDGEKKEAESNPMSIGKLYSGSDDPELTPTITVSGNTNIIRNESTTISYDVAGINGAQVRWIISDNWEGKVTTSGNTLTIAPDASWTKSISFTVQAEVIGGTSVKGDKNYHLKDPRDWRDSDVTLKSTNKLTFTVAPVGVTLKEVSKSETINRYGDTKYLSYELTNINTTGITDKIKVSDNPEYYYSKNNNNNETKYEFNELRGLFSVSDQGKTMKFNGIDKIWTSTYKNYPRRIKYNITISYDNSSSNKKTSNTLEWTIQ